VKGAHHANIELLDADLRPLHCVQRIDYGAYPHRHGHRRGLRRQVGRKHIAAPVEPSGVADGAVAHRGGLPARTTAATGAGPLASACTATRARTVSPAGEPNLPVLPGEDPEERPEWWMGARSPHRHGGKEDTTMGSAPVQGPFWSRAANDWRSAPAKPLPARYRRATGGSTLAPMIERR